MKVLYLLIYGLLAATAILYTGDQRELSVIVGGIVGLILGILCTVLAEVTDYLIKKCRGTLQ